MTAFAHLAEPTGSSSDGWAALLSLLSLGVTMLVLYLVCTWTSSIRWLNTAIRTVRNLPSQRAVAATTCRLCGEREATKAGKPCDDCLDTFRTELDRWGHEQDTA